jgi:hypothetical protein
MALPGFATAFISIVRGRGERAMRCASLFLVAAALLVATSASADYRNRHGDWWVECYNRDDGPLGYACAGRTVPRDGLQLYVVERRGQPFVVVQAEPGIQFDRSQQVLLRVDEGEFFAILAQQRRVAYLGGDPGLRLIGLMIEGKAASVSYHDLFGQRRFARFTLDGFEPTYRELKQAMAEVDQSVPRQARPTVPGTEPGAGGTAAQAAPAPNSQSDASDKNVVEDVVDEIGDFFGRIGRFIGRQFD